MLLKRSPIIAVAILGGVIAVGLSFVPLAQRTTEEISAAPTMESVVQDVLAARTQELLADAEVPFGEENVINVLVLGIDSRKEGEEQHCDAIHMFTVNVETWDVTVTSVPRGTSASLPKGDWKPHEYYLANACAYGGLEYGIAQIERIVGVKHDYLVTVGFSQALGVFRALGLPTTETLQWLRHRQSYAIGDPQRSHNQAVFMEDLVTRFTAEDAELPVALQYVLYKFIDTDMPFGTAKALYRGFADAGRGGDAITLAMKPYYATVDLHFDTENPDEQIAALLDRVRPYLSTDDLSDKPLEEYQTELIAYLTDALQQPEAAQHVVDAEEWRQVEDDAAREALHYAYVEWYVQSLAGTDAAAATAVLADYILEKQTLGVPEYEALGRQLMETIVQ